jgi:hypothetical protein
MSRTYIPQALRQHIFQQTPDRCGYCHTQSIVIGMPLVLDHIIPESLGGATEESNLWPACRRCNEFKGNQTHSNDPKSGEEVPLFNPRMQRWDAHFGWREDGTMIEGLTPTGRATVEQLRLNNDFIVKSRRRWVAVGWHPPHEEAG